MQGISWTRHLRLPTACTAPSCTPPPSTVHSTVRRSPTLTPDTAISRRWHVGDTPMDVRAAVEAGAGALAVATGNCPAERLEAARARPEEEIVVLPSLEDTGAVLEALGLH
jgi:phosphoglycolate phosphatase-like HAD superfamily hydrolase